MWVSILLLAPVVSGLFTCNSASQLFQEESCCDTHPDGDFTYPCEQPLEACQSNLLSCQSSNLELAGTINILSFLDANCQVQSTDCFNATRYQLDCASSVYDTCLASQNLCNGLFVGYDQFNRDRERDVLVEFHDNVLVGSDLFNNGGWPTGYPCVLSMGDYVSNWQGINCDTTTGLVRGFVFGNQNVTADISDMLFYLNQLPLLRTINEEFVPGLISGTMQESQVACLRNLRTFSIGSGADAGGLTGSIPRAFGDLPYLRTFRLTQQSMTGDIPQGLKDSTVLTSLTLRGNGFTDNVSSFFTRTNWITILLDSPGFTGALNTPFCDAAEGAPGFSCDLLDTGITCGSVSETCCQLSCP